MAKTYWPQFRDLEDQIKRFQVSGPIERFVQEMCKRGMLNGDELYGLCLSGDPAQQAERWELLHEMLGRGEL